MEPTGYQGLATALIHQKQWKEAVATINALKQRDWPERFGNVRGSAATLLRQVPDADRE
mgnify:FL=1